MAARVCPDCGEHWPVGKKYQWCPRCERTTRQVQEADPIPVVEAEELIGCYDKFKRWLAKHPDLEHPVLDLSHYDRITKSEADELARIPILNRPAPRGR